MLDYAGSVRQWPESSNIRALVFSTSFVMQWGIGALADMASTGFGLDPADGLRVAFAVVLAAETLAYLWFAMGWRRHALEGALASVAA